MAIPEVDVFNQGLPFDGPIDVKHLENIPNADVAQRTLAFMSDRGNEFDLYQRHTPADVARMWRATFRACLTHGVPVTRRQQGFAQRLGIIFP